MFLLMHELELATARTTAAAHLHLHAPENAKQGGVGQMWG